MPNSHIHDHLTDAQIKERNEAIVADYVSGLRTREVIKKYRISGELVKRLLVSAGVQARNGGPRNWVAKRVRKDADTEIICSKCGSIKPIDQYPKKGLVCSQCFDLHLSRWRERNRLKINSYVSGWMREKKKKDPKYRAICSMKCRLVRILGASGKKKSKASVTEFLGISRNGFIAHIESLMLPGMTWENRRLSVWHIDHIIPCSAFDHSDPKQVRECWHYTNLRPMWGKENLRKHNKILVDCMIGPKISANVTGE